MNGLPARKWWLSALLFTVSLAVYISTASHSLMFDDAAEFALVIRLGSIAHSPGFPAYILSGMLWDKVSQFFLSDAIMRLNIFSALLVSTASVLLYLGLRHISTRLSDGKKGWNMELSAFFPAAIFAFGNTTWLWANTIEVYSFQVFAMGLLLYGLCSYQTYRSFSRLMLAATGLALGWSNHHLTMIVFTPFVPFFFQDGLFGSENTLVSGSKKKKPADGNAFSGYLNILISRPFLQFTAISASMTLCCYGWMVWRAQQDYPFMFGKPENLDLLFYHIRGGAYTKNITDTSSSIAASRLPYFLQLTGRQFFLLLPLVFAGFYELFRNKAGRLSLSVIAFYLILLVYQLNNNQWSSTDAYLLLPFMVMCIPIVYALHRFMHRLKLMWIVPLVLVTTIAYGYPSHDRKTYPVSDSLMKLLDQSAPKNSVIMMSDWSTVIQFYYYQTMEGFRPDLDVLHYDFKFTHHRLLPLYHEKVYRMIKPEYDRYVEELRKEHPYQIVNTGCDLSTPELNKVFTQLVQKLESTCKSSGRVFLTDPRSHNLYSTSGFSSASPVDSSYNSAFLKLDFPFLSSPMLYDDPSCLDKLVDFQAMLDQHIAFYTANRDAIHQAEAEEAKYKVMTLQRKLKESMSFAYKVK